MGELVNRLSWSSTRAASYSRCLREYYWRAFGSWGGWDRARAPREAWLAYVFNKMKNLRMTSGELVHHAIEQVFSAHRHGRPIPTLPQLQARIRDGLRQAWRESAEKRWETSPKNYFNLAEHYYGPVPDRASCEHIRDDAFRAIAHFLDLELTGRVLASPPGNIRSVETLEEFDLGGHLIFIKIDLAWNDGRKLHLIDWKSGNRDEGVAEQLAAYALFARERWGVADEEMTGYPVYLRDGTVGENCISAESVNRLRESIDAYFADVRLRLADPDRALARSEAFPLTDQTWKCANCFYRQLCGRDVSTAPTDASG